MLETCVTAVSATLKKPLRLRPWTRTFPPSVTNISEDRNLPTAPFKASIAAVISLWSVADFTTSLAAAIATFRASTAF